MKVIALKGDENKGKSMTLNIVYHRLIASGATQTIPLRFRELGAAEQRDFLDVLSYNGLTIGFATLGDHDNTEQGNSVKDLLAELDSYGCDLAITACRNEGDTFNSVTAYMPHIIISKTPARAKSNERIYNLQDALAIEKNI